MNFKSASKPLTGQPQSKPLDVSRTFEQALAFHHSGRLSEAERLYTAVLAARADHFDALQMLGLIKLGRGEASAALQLISTALQSRPNSPQALLNRGLVLNALNRHQEALASFDLALKHKGRYAEALNNRGCVLAALGRDEEALEDYRRTIGIKPDYTDAHYNQGISQQKLNCHADSLKSFDRALALDPNHAKAHNNRGTALQLLRRPEEALTAYDRALTLRPDFDEALNNRVTVLRLSNRHDEALQSVDRLLSLRPGYAEAHNSRGALMSDFNRSTEAVQSYEHAVSLKPDYSEARWSACLATLPILYGEESEITERRTDYARRLYAFCTDVVADRVPGDLTRGIGRAQPFFLAYQGYNDRDLQRLFGTLMTHVVGKRYPQAELALPPEPGEPVRVGIVTGFFRQHSVWKIGAKGWVSQLDRKRFQVYGYHTGLQEDDETAFAKAQCHRFVHGETSIDRWRKQILADKPHVLLYPEIGMNAEASVLAAQRLAPVQCSFIGHPQTSGMPTIDYFLSGALIEPSDGAEHYSETLVRLPNIGLYYEPLQLPAVEVTREQLGLRPGAVAYWCTQSLFKYLPQHDCVFARIARQIGDCQFVFIRHEPKQVTEFLQNRLQRAFEAEGLNASDHCVFLAPMEMARFSAAAGQCDAMLDSIGWSGGNTTLEALAQHLPMVTFQGPLMRGRVSAGILRMLGMPEVIAETVDDYIAIAVRLGRDTAWRDSLKDSIARNLDRVYRDRASIVALEEFLDRVARRQQDLAIPAPAA